MALKLNELTVTNAINGGVTGTAGSISGFNNPAVAATANTIVYRSGGGDITGAYILGSYFNASAGNSENPTIGQIWTQNTTDNYLRKSTPAWFRSQVTDGSYPSLTGANASGTWSISVSGNAATATTAVSATSATSATFLNSSNYINRCGSAGNANTDFQNTPAGSVRHNGDDSNLTNSPGGTWWFYDNYRHSNSSNYWGTQIAWGWEDNANRLATRNITGGTFGGWVYYLNSANYNSYSPTLTGTGASGTWSINVTGNAGGSSTSCSGNAATVTGITNQNSGNTDLNTLTTSGFYRLSNAAANDPTSNKYGQLLVIHGGSDTITQILGDYGTGNLWTRGGNPTNVGGVGSWTSWKLVLDSVNYTSYAPTLTGTGASGTWAINITGNAATATNGGVTSISAGVGIGTSAGTGAVTITNSSPNATHTGDVTGATALTIANAAVTNAKLANSSVTIGSTAVSLGATVTTFAGLASVTSTAFVGALTGNASTATALTSMNISQFTNNSGYLTSVTNISGNAGTVTYSPGRTDATAYPILWGAGTTTTLAYSCAAVNIQSSTGILSATSFSGAGTGLTGTAASLSIGGSAASATTAGSCSGNAASATTAAACTGNAATATTATNVGVGSGNTSAAWYPVVWHSGNTLYSSAGVQIYAANNYVQATYFNSSDNDETGITRFVIKNGDGYHRSATPTSAAVIIRGVASGTWSITAATATNVAASGITGQTGMWTSAARPGPYRLYRRDADDAYSVQNYWTGVYWRLDGYYSNDTLHAGCSVSYADTAGTANALNTSNNYRVTNFGIDISPANKLHINGDNVNPTIRVDNGAVVLAASAASNSKTFYGWLPIAIGTAGTKYIQLYT